METIIIVCNLRLDKAAEIPVKRTLIDMGLIKEAVREYQGAELVYKVTCTPEQAEQIKKLHP